jgi:hypothetical protein
MAVGAVLLRPAGSGNSEKRRSHIKGAFKILPSRPRQPSRGGRAAEEYQNSATENSSLHGVQKEMAELGHNLLRYRTSTGQGEVPT